MKKRIHDSILQHYTELYKKFGKHPASIGWPKGRQKLRFKIMSEIGELKNTKILDVGCGFGDFFSYLKSKRKNVNYTGTDINPIFIEIAKSSHPDVIFYCRDIEKKRFQKKFDWVFAIGTTNRAADYNYVESLLREMFRLCRKGVAMDFMSTYVDFKRRGSTHFAPEKIFVIGKKLSRRVVIRHDYLPFEFCVYLYKNNKLTKNHVFSEYY